MQRAIANNPNNRESIAKVLSQLRGRVALEAERLGGSLTQTQVCADGSVVV